MMLTRSAVEKSLSSKPDSTNAFFAMVISSRAINSSLGVNKLPPSSISSSGEEAARSKTVSIPPRFNFVIKLGFIPGRSSKRSS